MTAYYAKCHACGHEWLTSMSAGTLGAHESRYHDGAQTVWTAEDEVAASRERSDSSATPESSGHTTSCRQVAT